MPNQQEKFLQAGQEPGGACLYRLSLQAMAYDLAPELQFPQGISYLPFFLPSIAQYRDALASFAGNYCGASSTRRVLGCLEKATDFSKVWSLLLRLQPFLKQRVAGFERHGSPAIVPVV
ncbi:MAG TPA: hypothetical protein VF452_10610 [Candidatus Binatia bacterium]